MIRRVGVETASVTATMADLSHHPKCRARPNQPPKLGIAATPSVHKAVTLLCEQAAAGDVAAAKALIPWINQALGTPTERVEHRLPGGLEELERMDEAELERLVAKGRERRLRVVPEPMPD